MRFFGAFIFLASFISHARYGLGLWVVGGGEVGGMMLSSNVLNPGTSSINPGLKEMDKTGLLFGAKGGLSWYGSSVFVVDLLGGWSSVNLTSKAPAGGKAIEIKKGLSFVEVFPRFRFGDLGRWQLGPVYRGLMGSNADFSESVSSTEKKSSMNFLGIGFNFDMTSATEKTLYRIGLQALTDISDTRSIYMGNLSFQIGFDLFGSGEAMPYSFQPELYPGEDVGVLPVVQSLPLVEEGISVRESEPMPLKEEFNETPTQKMNLPSTETPLLQNIEGQSADLSSEMKNTVSDEKSVVIQLPSDSFRFASGMSHIGSSQSRDYLKNLGAFLAENDQSFQGLTIVGHTDKRGPAGREREVNMELSEARAKSVYEVLIAGGASADKLRYEGKAFDEPVEGAPDNSKGWKLNRRVELNLQAVSNSELLIDGINQLKKKFGIQQKAQVKD